VIFLRCGAKCFQVELEKDSGKLLKPVVARTPAEVRKRIRKEFGTEVQIVSVREEKKKR
jgi:mitochondrial fission protein ELM1